MDRTLVYPGSIPLDTDLLQTNRNVQAAIGFLASMVVGTGPVCDGLAFSPTQPASLTINIGPGSYTVASQVDQLAYGSLSTDASPLVKMGINLAATQFTLTAPSVPGQSINYIIEATLQENDANPVVLPYLNAANPAQTFAGPSNSGAAQNTLRIQRVGLQLKAGAAANTGTQLTPAVDIGWTAIYIITVNFGQTQITAPNVGIAPGAPFINPKLGFGGVNVRIKLQQDLNLYVATTGSDSSGNGTQAAPFATLQAAWDQLLKFYDLNGHNATINVANGTYGQGVLCVGLPPGCSSTNPISGNPLNCITFLGNTSSPSSVVIGVTNGNCFTTQGQAQIVVKGFQLAASGVSSGNYQNSGTALYAIDHSGITFGNVVFSPSTVHMNASNFGFISSAGNPYTITGGGQSHLYASQLGLLVLAGSTVTVTGNPNFTQPFAFSQTLAEINANGTTFNGSATGQKYSVIINAIILTSGSGPNFFPGSTAGVFATGGQYI